MYKFTVLIPHAPFSLCQRKIRKKERTYHEPILGTSKLLILNKQKHH